VETKQIGSSNSNVILTQQTCGKYSSMAAACKRRVLAFYFSIRICYKFPISKYRGESDLGLCITSGPPKRMLLRSADFRRILRPNTSTFACHSHARALAAGLPQQDHFWITTDYLFRFHNNEFDEMLCELDSTEFARSFRTKPNLAISSVFRAKERKKQRFKSDWVWFWESKNERQQDLQAISTSVPIDVPIAWRSRLES